MKISNFQYQSTITLDENEYANFMSQIVQIRSQFNEFKLIDFISKYRKKFDLNVTVSWILTCLILRTSYPYLSSSQLNSQTNFPYSLKFKLTEDCCYFTYCYFSLEDVVCRPLPPLRVFENVQFYRTEFKFYMTSEGVDFENSDILPKELATIVFNLLIDYCSETC